MMVRAQGVFASQDENGYLIRNGEQSEWESLIRAMKWPFEQHRMSPLA